jgi:orotate phosphoribosyltransferase
MIYSKKTAEETARLLLQINAIKLNPESPFTWASGWKSPIYCDNRLALSYPDVRDFLAESLAEQVIALYGKNITLAGVATGAIGIGMLVAQKLNVSFVYVRPEPKKHGRKNQIEGYANPALPIVVIEDLISTGKSSLNAVKAIREEGLEVLGMLALFSYGFNVAKENFETEKVQLNILSDYDHLLVFANEQNAITNEQRMALSSWRENPAQWKP